MKNIIIAVCVVLCLSSCGKTYQCTLPGAGNNYTTKTFKNEAEKKDWEAKNFSTCK
jgi:uncharacterized protein YceK